MDRVLITRTLALCLLVTSLVCPLFGDVEPGSSDGATNDGGGIHLDLKEGAVMGNYEAGQTQLMNIQRDSQHPRYGSCWTNALQVVSTGCKRLTDDEQSRMALTLANCHLSKAGFDTYPCDDSADMRECLNPMKDSAIAFNAYTEFFTHTQDICFFLQSQVWHEHTEQTVEKLAQSSEDVAEQMEVSGRLQESMIEQQNRSLINQERILAQEAQLREALKTSTNSIQEVFAEMRSSTLEQKALFAETFDRVAQVQHLMLGEFTWFNSVVYFVVVLGLAYMVTSTPRTAGARFGLFLLLLLNWLTEWLLFRITDHNDQTLFHARTWLCRKAFCFLGFLHLVHRACRYQDLNQVNHHILLQIQNELRQRALNPAPHEQAPESKPLSLVQSVSGAPLLSIVSPKQTPAIQYRPNRRTVQLSQSKLSVTEFTSDGSDDEGRDVTFNPENLASSESHDSSSSEHSFVTANPMSRKSSAVGASVPKTPHNVGVASMSQESRSREMGSSAKRKRGRPKGSKNSPIPSFAQPAQFQSPYNLRQRAPHQSPSNPILDLETTLMFAEQVKSMASRHFVIQKTRNTPPSSGRARRGRSPATSHASPAFFSSDDEP